MYQLDSYCPSLLAERDIAVHPLPQGTSIFEISRYINASGRSATADLWSWLTSVRNNVSCVGITCGCDPRFLGEAHEPDQSCTSGWGSFVVPTWQTTGKHLIVGFKGVTVFEGNLVSTNVVHGFRVESSADTVHYLPSSQETVPLDSCERRLSPCS